MNLPGKTPSAPSDNTEASERLHIDFAKHAYVASNRKDYIEQMKTWLARRESIDTFFSYLCWAVPGYGMADGIDGIDDPKAAGTSAPDPDDEDEEEPPTIARPISPAPPVPHNTSEILYSVAS